MISGERHKVRRKAVRWPCGVCSKGVGSSSLQCNSCQKWVHKKCSGIKGSMSKVAESFICSGCSNQAATGYANQHKSVSVPSQDKLGGLRGRKGIRHNMGKGTTGAIFYGKTDAGEF